MVGLPPTPQELRALRKRARLTQREIAKRAGISQALVARIESGDVDPRVSTLNKILKVINNASSDRVKAKDVMHQPVIAIRPDDTVGKAIEIFRKHGISQLPVIEDDKVVGSIREETILRDLKNGKINDLLNASVGDLLEEAFPIVSMNTDIDEISKMLSSGDSVVLVSEHGRMVGIIAKIDLIAKHLL